MSDTIGERHGMTRLQRDIAAWEDRAARQREREQQREKWDPLLIAAPIMALGGLAVGALGLLVAFVRH